MAPAAEDVKAAIRARVERKALSAPRKVLKLSDAQLEPARRRFAASGGEETRLARCDGRSSAHE